MRNGSLKQRFGVAISKNYLWGFSTEDGKFVLIDIRTNEKFEPSDFNTKILVYEDRVKEWFFEVAERLKEDNEAGFVILQIAVSYIEGNQQLRKGSASNRNSKNFFIEAMKRIFDLDDTHDNLLVDFYEQVRCGLFHNGMTGEKVLISGQNPEALKIESDKILVNQNKFLDKVKEDLDSYISDLKNGKSPEKENFERMFYFGQS